MAAVPAGQEPVSCAAVLPPSRVAFAALRAVMAVLAGTLGIAAAGNFALRPSANSAPGLEQRRVPTFVVATHDVMTARRIGDYINVLWNGRVEEAGPSEQVLLHSRSPFVHQFLGGHAVGPVAMD